MTVLVLTGAAGNLGVKFGNHLDAGGKYEVRRIDLAPRGDERILQADLSLPSPGWMRMLAGAEVVVHLAAHPRAGAQWGELVGPNLDAVLNLYLAAARHGVGRVVFASSIWAMAARRDASNGGVIRAGRPDPGANAYGASKLFGERVANAFFHSHGIDTVIVRIGGCRPGSNPRVHTGDAWEDQAWLSDADLCRGLELAASAKIEGCVVVNLVSDNPGSRWSREEARDLIGFRPTPLAPFATPRRRGLAARILGRLRA